MERYKDIEADDGALWSSNLEKKGNVLSDGGPMTCTLLSIRNI